MNLSKKKALAAKTFKVGKERIVFLASRINDIKEAITKNDFRDLNAEGAIIVKEVSGRRKNLKKKANRSTGNIRKKVKTRKQDYVIMTRKLRRYTKEMEKQGQINREERLEIRKKIRNKAFKSQAHLKDYIKNLRK
jgi:ribosomal protein L19E